MTEPFGGGDPHGIIFEPGLMAEHSSAVLLAKDVGNYLEKAYPGGWLWAIETDPRGGVLNIRSLRCSGEWGYVLKLAWLDDPVARRRLVLKAAGEIIERFGMKAGPFDFDRYKLVRRDIAGDPSPDLSDKHAKIRRHQRDVSLTNAVKNGSVTVHHADVGGTRQILIAGGTRKREG